MRFILVFVGKYNLQIKYIANVNRLSNVEKKIQMTKSRQFITCKYDLFYLKKANIFFTILSRNLVKQHVLKMLYRLAWCCQYAFLPLYRPDLLERLGGGGGGESAFPCWILLRLYFSCSPTAVERELVNAWNPNPKLVCPNLKF